MEENKVKDMNFKVYVCRSQRMAGWLMFRGFKLLTPVEPDRDFPQRNVFKFFNSQPLLDTIAIYKQLDK